jgi:hypothetical protein
MSTQTTYPKTASRRNAARHAIAGASAAAPSSDPRSSTMHLINEALARARMRLPQTVESEAASDPAGRGARHIAIRARHAQARALGHLPPVR